MNWLSRFLKSTIGMKVVMASTGVVLFGFVFVHMIGNLNYFLGEEALNHYAAMLQSNKELVYIARAVLLAAVVGHIFSAVQLTLRSRSARPVGYGQKRWMRGNYAARTMKYGGFVLLIFIVFHLLHMTTGDIQTGEFTHCDPLHGSCDTYANVFNAFAGITVTLFYVVAQFALGLHLAHGAWSMCRTLGLSNPRYDKIVKAGALTLGFIIAVGNSAIPIAVYLSH